MSEHKANETKFKDAAVGMVLIFDSSSYENGKWVACTDKATVVEIKTTKTGRITLLCDSKHGKSHKAFQNGAANPDSFIYR